MLDPVRIHTEVYNLLMQYRSHTPSLHFTFRISNRGGMLEKGYLFDGDEWHLAVSFWTGTDWRNKTPNISFIILFKTGETYLEVNVSDSDKKREFVNQYLLQELNLKITGTQYRKNYQGNYLHTLQQFLKNDKVIIDEIISNYAQTFFSNKEQGIFFIEPSEFNEQQKKVERYKKDEFPVTQNQINQKPVKLSTIRIENYGPIRNIEIPEIPYSSQWIFLTGENGTGKTSILRALTACICNKNIETDPQCPKTRVRLEFYLSSKQKQIHTYSPPDSFTTSIHQPIVNGFAAYGQSRLRTNNRIKKHRETEIDINDVTSSIFDEDAYLIDLQYQFDQWASEKNNRYKKRRKYITEILTDILPNLYNINFNDKVGVGQVTTYIEKDSEGETFRKVTFDKLASGLKSLVAMIGDILIRLYNQQPDIDDPSEFTGVVLIDEIDIHLHPKLQKSIVQQLTKTFPQVQFIVSTHSPVPFLGAPRNSRIFKIERNSKEGVTAKRLDQFLELGSLLPNTILTSPIFGLEDIIPESHNPEKMIRTETHYTDIEFNNLLTAKITAFLTNEKEKELINLFKSGKE